MHRRFEGELGDDGSWVAWRLTGANHRELGRSPRVFPNLDRARHHAQLVHDRIDDAAAEIVSLPHPATWGWQLRLEGFPLVTSSRGYARYRDAAYSLAACAAAAAIADVVVGEPPRS